MNTSQHCDGIDLGLVKQTWIKLAASEMRLELLKDLIALDIGLNEVEGFCSDLRLKFRSKTLSNKSDSEKGVVREAMRLKLLDERKYSQELTRDRNKWRRQLKTTMEDNPRKFRSVIKFLRGEAAGEKSD